MLNLKTIWENIFDKIKAVYGLHRIGPDSKRIQELKDNNIPNYVIWMFYRAGTDINNTDSGKNKAGQIYRGKLTATKGAKTAIDYLVNLLDYVGLGTEQKYLLNLFKTSVVAYRYIQVSLDDCNIKEKYDKYIEENTEEVEKSLEELNDLIFEKIKEIFDEFMASSEENAQSLIDEFGVDKMQITKEKATQVLTVLISLALLSIDSKTKLPCDTAYVDKINFDKLKLGLKKYISEEFKNNSESDEKSIQNHSTETISTKVFKIEYNLSINETIDDIEKYLKDVLQRFVSSDDIFEVHEYKRKIKNFICKYFDFARHKLRSIIGDKDFDIHWLEETIGGHVKWWEDFIYPYLNQLPLIDDVDVMKSRTLYAMYECEVVIQACILEITLLEESLRHDTNIIKKNRRIEEVKRNKQDAYDKFDKIETEIYSIEASIAKTHSSDIGAK